jgi:predicted dehydrogenase
MKGARGVAKVRMAVVGCGGIAGAHQRGWKAIYEKEPELAEIVATCDAYRPAAERYADQVAEYQGSRPQVFDSVGEMLRTGRVQAADVCTPHYLHHRVALECIDAGVAVQVEKPSGLTVKATKRMIEAACARDVILATAENVRRGPSQRTAWWLLNESGLLGRAQGFFIQQVQYAQPADPQKAPNWHWRAERTLSAGGWVVDSGAHFMDTIRYLYGDVHSVYGRVEQLRPHPMQKQGLRAFDEQEDYFTATINFESGVIGQWSRTSAFPGHDWFQCAIYATQGAIVDPSGDIFHGPHGKAEVRRPGQEAQTLGALFPTFLETLSPERKQRLFPHDFTDGFTLECYDFAQAVATGRQVEVTAEVGLKAKAIAFAIYESAATGQAVTLDDVLSGRVEVYQRWLNEKWGI